MNREQQGGGLFFLQNEKAQDGQQQSAMYQPEWIGYARKSKN